MSNVPNAGVRTGNCTIELQYVPTGKTHPLPLTLLHMNFPSRKQTRDWLSHMCIAEEGVPFHLLTNDRFHCRFAPQSVLPVPAQSRTPRGLAAMPSRITHNCTPTSTQSQHTPAAQRSRRRPLTWSISQFDGGET